MKKRHPRNCKRLAFEKGCRHKENCAYHHNVKFQEADKTKEKVSQLEKLVDDLTNNITNHETEKVKELYKIVKVLVRKVLSLESKIIEMKQNQIKSDGTEKKVLSDLKEMKYTNSQSSPKDVKVPEEKPVEEAEAILKGTKLLKKADLKKTDLKSIKCEKCDYVCKKVSTMKNHVTTKHTIQICKVCSNKFKSSIELINHVAMIAMIPCQTKYCRMKRVYKMTGGKGL